MSAPHPIPADVREDLAILVHRFRRRVDGPAWDLAGIRVALDRCGGQPCEIAAAAFAAAANPTIRTPGMIPLPGAHWPVINGTHVAPRRSYNIPCHAHPDQPMPCATCRAEYVPPRPETIANAYEALRQARANPPETPEQVRARKAAQ